jgi:hypothetical protein
LMQRLPTECSTAQFHPSMTKSTPADAFGHSVLGVELKRRLRCPASLGVKFIDGGPSRLLISTTHNFATRRTNAADGSTRMGGAMRPRINFPASEKIKSSCGKARGVSPVSLPGRAVTSSAVT